MATAVPVELVILAGYGGASEGNRRRVHRHRRPNRTSFALHLAHGTPQGVRALEDTSAAAAAAVAAASGKERLAPLQRPRVGSAPAAASAAPAPAPEPEPASAAAAAPAPAPAAPPKAVPLHRPAKPSATEAETPDAHSSPQAPAHPPPAAPTPSATAPQAAPSASSAVSIPKADALAPPPCGSASSASLLRLKSELLDLVYGTSRGVAASAEQQRAIDKVVCALEARNPHAATTDVSGCGRVEGRRVCGKLVGVRPGGKVSGWGRIDDRRDSLRLGIVGVRPGGTEAARGGHRREQGHGRMGNEEHGGRGRLEDGSGLQGGSTGGSSAVYADFWG